MKIDNPYLFIAGCLCLLASILHLAIIVGGEQWYLFFGAGRGFALLARDGSLYPTIVTSGIALVLAIWSIYAFSGAKLIGKLPFIKPILIIIALIFLLRGILGIPLTYLIDDPYLMELREKSIFMVISSLISAFIGFCIVKGLRLRNIGQNAA